MKSRGDPQAGGLALVTTALSLASLPFILPHVVEDFAEGIAARAHLSTGAAASLLGAWLALQAVGLLLLAHRRRAGWAVTFCVGVVWVAGAAVEHGPAVLAGGFRSGASPVWLAGLVAMQAAAAALAWLGWRRTRAPRRAA